MKFPRIFMAFFLSALLAANPLPASAAAESSKAPDIQTKSFHGTEYLVRRVDLDRERIHLYLHDDSGKPLRSFAALQKYVTAQGQALDFAANAGMYEEDRSTVGLLIQHGIVTRKLNLKDAQGNFYLKPNGVFFIDHDHRARVMESSRYEGLEESSLWATQSGPLLVNHGKIHPAFVKNSVNRLIRSGVGVTESGLVIFVISKGPVNFYDFAEYFKSLDCPNALFLDGTVSAFYSPTHPETIPHNFGPMVGVVKAEKN